MSPDIADLDRRIRACMIKHGITDADLKFHRRQKAMIAAAKSIAAFGVSMQEFSAAMQRATAQIRQNLPALRQFYEQNQSATKGR
jgi:hypothetical protein